MFEKKKPWRLNRYLCPDELKIIFSSLNGGSTKLKQWLKQSKFSQFSNLHKTDICILLSSCAIMWVLDLPMRLLVWANVKKAFPLDMESFRNFQRKILAEWKVTRETPSRESWNPRWHRNNQNVSQIPWAVESGKDTRRWTSNSKQRFSFAYDPSHKFNQRTALLFEDQSASFLMIFFYK